MLSIKYPKAPNGRGYVAVQFIETGIVGTIQAEQWHTGCTPGYDIFITLSRETKVDGWSFDHYVRVDAETTGGLVVTSIYDIKVTII